MRRAVIALAALSAAVLPGASHAQTAGDKADARCILVLNLAAAQSAQNPQQREKASQGVYFYTGKLNAHGASPRLGAIMIGEAKAITTPQQAEQVLAEGSADAVVMARELLRNPHWPLLAAAELGEDTDLWPDQYLRAVPRKA